MAGQYRKWMVLAGAIWIQALTGTNLDFPAYSSLMKAALGISQAQLSHLAVASDLSKIFGWSFGIARSRLPLRVVLFIASFMDLFGYGLQWLVVLEAISLPYLVIYACRAICIELNFISWFYTVCFVLCNRNFPSHRPLALSLTLSFNGVSAALYALAAPAVDPLSDALYLLLNATIPLAASAAALLQLLHQPPQDTFPPAAAHRLDSLIFLLLNFTAVATGIYLLLPGSANPPIAPLLFAGAVFVLLPATIPSSVYVGLFDKVYAGVDGDDVDLRKELLAGESRGGLCERVEEGDRVMELGKEPGAWEVMRRLEFWVYYVAYLCGGTIGSAYSNNLGQIAQSLGHGSETSTHVTIYSSFSFFGRLLSAAPDFMRGKVSFARTGWLAVALVPTPVAFFLLATTGGATTALHASSTAMIGLSSGFIFAAAVSVTSELFGPTNVGVNHNILVTNIPIGSFVYGQLAALTYDSHAGRTAIGSSNAAEPLGCTGRDCYVLTFAFCSFFLFFQTRSAY
ncbi:hypothetical protein NMG60_11027757 [Bertholletia excelsa]